VSEGTEGGQSTSMFFLIIFYFALSVPLAVAEAETEKYHKITLSRSIFGLTGNRKYQKRSQEKL
jgi:hypothetical protein